MRIANMRNIVAGTAGHIDHGKTALVRALTGIDTDRLEEEKRRGISIDIGFAHLEPGGDTRIGLVDVPGHEKFIKNMLAGVGGIDFVLFVVAADESIKPQTREHFEICRLLNIPQGIVVLTKADLVEAELLDLVRMEVEEFVAGSFLEGAPVMAVSSITGQGIAELRARMAELARAVRPKDSAQYFRLPIDRAFSLRGFGTIVTGTLVSGSIALEQEVELHPGRRRIRVRGIEVHGQKAGRAWAGQRTALNLAGVEPSDLHRGMVLAEPARFTAARQIDTRFELLEGAKPLKQRAPVHFHAGTAEVEAEARLTDGASALGPGQEGFVRFMLREPLLLLPGDRFIVRMFSPVVTIGGGTVLDIEPPRKRRADAVARLEVLWKAPLADRIGLLVRESPFGRSVAELSSRTGLLEKVIEQNAGKTLLLKEPRTWLIDPEAFRSLDKRLHAVLAAFHQQNPLLAGMSREELRSRELPGAPPFLLEAVLASSKTLAAQGEMVRLAAHKLALKQDESAALDKMESLFREAGLAVPSQAEVLAKSGVEAARARTLLQLLLRDRKLVRISDELVLHASAVARLKELLAGRKGERFAVPAFKEWTGVSRKYAIPLLEFLDRERVTRREGDQRVVL